MPNIEVFNPRAMNRIRDNVKWGEGVRKQGNFITKPQAPLNDFSAWVILTEKDPNGATGFWRAQEIIYQDGNPVAWDNGKLFDGDDFPFIRHVDWEDSRVGEIVRVFTHIDSTSESKTINWVFEKDIPNPESFKFYCDDFSNVKQGLADSVWTMEKGGTVYTNHGKIKVSDGFTITGGQTAYCKIIANRDYRLEWDVVSAEMTTEEGEYWSLEYDELTIVVPIGKAEKINKVSRFEQYHTGDLYFELIDNNTTVSGDKIWIDVTRNLNNYNVSHILPGTTEYFQDQFLAFDNDCESVPTSSFEDFIGWFKQYAVTIRYDTRGHIYERQPCNGSVENHKTDDDPESPAQLNVDFSASGDTSFLKPNSISLTDGLSSSLTINNGGANFIDFVGVESTRFIIVNANGATISTDKTVANSFPNSALMQNVNNTSGNSYSGVVPTAPNFLFNSTVTVKGSVIGKGLGGEEILNTLPVTLSVTNDKDGIIYRKADESAGTGTTITLTYSENLSTAYTAVVNFRFADGGQVSLVDQNDNILTGEQNYAINGTSPTATIRIRGNFGTEIAQQTVIVATVRTIHTDSGNEVNIESRDIFYVGGESSCFLDEKGNELEDDSGTGSCFDGSFIISPSYFRATARGTGSYSASFTDARSNIESDSYHLTFTSSATAIIQPYDGTSIFDLDRGYAYFDASDATTIDIDVDELSRDTAGTDAGYSLVYTTTDPSSTVSGIDSWTVIGTGTVSGTSSSTTVTNTVSYNTSALSGIVYVGIIMDSDKNNSPVSYASSLTSNTYHGARIATIKGYI